MVFETTFKNEKSRFSAPKAFVKGGIIDQTMKLIEDKDKGDIYLPSFKPNIIQENRFNLSENNIGSSDSKIDRGF